MTAGSSAFEKRLRRRVSGKTGAFFAVCPPGLPPLCQAELQQLTRRLDSLGLLPPGQAIDQIQVQPGGVDFMARLDMACLANLFLGTPTRILMRIARFRADHFATFEKGLKDIDWELFLPRGILPRIQATARKSKLIHTDALADRCRKVLTGRLGGDSRDNDQTVMIRGEQDWFDISLDMSGHPLFKRGIKSRVIRAPLRETLAFAVLKKLALTREDILADPMAGSGTFSLEGAMMQSGIPPGLFRAFAFEQWPGFQARRFDYAREQIREKIDLEGLPPIHAWDIDQPAIEAMTETVSSRAFLSRIDIRCKNFFKNPAPADTGVVVLNPPYGKRLGKEKDITLFYRDIGQKLRQDYRGWRAGIICPKPHLVKELNLPFTSMPLFHGGLDITAAIGRVV